MSNLSTLPSQLDPKKCTCRAIIETPKGCRNKFDYDPDSGLFMLGGLLPEGMIFPFDFGFIPSTLGEDGDLAEELLPRPRVHAGEADGLERDDLLPVGGAEWADGDVLLELLEVQLGHGSLRAGGGIMTRGGRCTKGNLAVAIQGNVWQRGT